MNQNLVCAMTSGPLNQCAFPSSSTAHQNALLGAFVQSTPACIIEVPPLEDTLTIAELSNLTIQWDTISMED